MHSFLNFFIINCLLLKCSTELISEEHEHGLCRQCGNDIACLDLINNIESPEAVLVRNSSILSEGREVKVQIFINKEGNIFPVFTLKTANCPTFVQWDLTNTWFPGFYWSPCFCPQCGHQLGWAFKKDLTSKHADFFGLIESNILREGFVDKLLVVSKISCFYLDTMANDEELLKQLEEKFKDRYTDSDNEYDLKLKKEDLLPPVRIDWEKREKRNWNDREYGRYNNRGEQQREYKRVASRYDDGRDRSEKRDRRDDNSYRDRRDYDRRDRSNWHGDRWGSDRR